MRGREGGGGMRGEQEIQRGQGGERRRGSWRTSMVDPSGLFDMGMGEGIVDVEGMEGLVGGVEGVEVVGGEAETNEKGGDEGIFDQWMREVMRALEGGEGGDVSGDASMGEETSTNEAHLINEETRENRTKPRPLPLPNLTTLDISSALFPVSTALVVVETLTGRVFETHGGVESSQSKLETLSLTGCYWMQDDVERVLDCVAPLASKEASSEAAGDENKQHSENRQGLKTLRMSLHTLTPRVLKMLNTRLENPEFVDVGLGGCVGMMSRGIEGRSTNDGNGQRCRVELIVKCGDTRGSVGSTASSVMTSRTRETRRVMKSGSGTSSRVSGLRSGAGSGTGFGGLGGMMDMSMREASMGPVSIVAAQGSRALRKASKTVSTSTSTSTSSTAIATATATGVEVCAR
ncbi:hypothetical protein BJ165DRAFT_1499969 [Panaeolus papilionaceus]|nr:hypothetical protein BJ165DRAFT_1499969 [Panaeolus papilionaceus]